MLTHSPKQQLGFQAEQQAEKFLRKQGLKFIARNFHCRLGEIDLIMQDRDSLVFIEVRYRNAQHYGVAAETINTRKQHKIIKAASFYLLKHNLHEKIPCRFDVITLSKNSEDIDWIKDAFQVKY